MDIIVDTHPWIRFKIDLREIPVATWIALGECVSKIQHMVGTPLTPRIAAEMRMAFVSKGIHGTAEIEGNTLELEEVRQRLRHELDLPESQEYLGREIDNLNRAYEFLAEVIGSNPAPEITEERIQEYNQLILDGLELEAGIVAGQYATKQHGVGNYRAPSPADIRRLMPELVGWLNDEADWTPPNGVPWLVVCILKAIVAHLYIAWVHPFGDGNGRVARMLEAEILARGGVPSLSYHLLADHYNRTRAEYYRILSRTSRTPQGRPGIFIEYAAQGLADALREQITQVKSQHREVVWRDYVHDCFRGRDSVRYLRLRRLAMDLARVPEPVLKSEVWAVSERVRNSYRDKTSKTVTRDLNELREMDLVRRTPDGLYYANLDILTAFVPARRADAG